MYLLISCLLAPSSLNVPHGLTLAEDKNLLCVADRENGRVQCFNSDSGNFVKSIQPPEFGSTIYSVAYAKNTGMSFFLKSITLLLNHTCHVTILRWPLILHSQFYLAFNSFTCPKSNYCRLFPSCSFLDTILPH